MGTTSNCSVATSCFKSTQRQLTIMLVMICCAAVCLQLPYTVLYLLNAEKSSLWPNQEILHAEIYFWRKVTDMVATSNYAVNFVLYCVSGSAFRRGVQAMCRRRRTPQRYGGLHQYQQAITMTALTTANTNRLIVSAVNSRRTSDLSEYDIRDQPSHV